MTKIEYDKKMAVLEEARSEAYQAWHKTYQASREANNECGRANKACSEADQECGRANKAWREADQVLDKTYQAIDDLKESWAQESGVGK